ncbi:unnamed protein product, partial [Phaeothamnion confervicola]
KKEPQPSSNGYNVAMKLLINDKDAASGRSIGNEDPAAVFAAKLLQKPFFQLPEQEQIDVLAGVKSHLEESLSSVVLFRCAAETFVRQCRFSDTSLTGGLLQLLDHAPRSKHGDAVRALAGDILGQIGAAGIEPWDLKEVLRRLRSPSPSTVPLLTALAKMASPRGARRGAKGWRRRGGTDDLDGEDNGLSGYRFPASAGDGELHADPAPDDPGPSLSGFFAFGGEGSGLRLPLADWPFPHEYQVALWLRVEAFPGSRRSSGGGGGENGNNRAHVLRLSSPDGLGIDYYLEDSQLCVAVDDRYKGAAIRKVQYLRLTLHRRRWYRLVIHHARPSSVLFRQDSLQLFCDGRLEFDEPLPYPRGIGPLSICIVGGDLDGEIGAVLIYSQAEALETVHAMLDCFVAGVPAAIAGGASGGDGTA